MTTDLRHTWSWRDVLLALGITGLTSLEAISHQGGAPRSRLERPARDDTSGDPPGIPPVVEEPRPDPDRCWAIQDPNLGVVVKDGRGRTWIPIAYDRSHTRFALAHLLPDQSQLAGLIDLDDHPYHVAHLGEGWSFGAGWKAFPNAQDRGWPVMQWVVRRRVWWYEP